MAEREREDRQEELVEPSFWREVRTLTWLLAKLLAKVIGVMLVIAGVLTPAFRWSPVAGIVLLYGMVLAGMIGMFAWWSYKAKKATFEQQKKNRAQWEEARSRLRGGKTA
jgi:hypothetical protein